MSFFRRAKEMTGDLASAGKRQAQRGKLELEVRRLESKIGSEKAAFGEAVYPLLEAGTLTVGLPDVETHMKAITDLLAEIAAKQAEIDALGAPEGEAPDTDQAASIAHIDTNATGDAAAAQSAKDAAAESKGGTPADEGGQG